MIEIKHLTKRYGELCAVNDLNLTVEPGKIYGFLGPNGAGKSTTMNIITGYIGATEGEVLINGHDIFKDPIEAKKCIGYLPEMPPLYPDMSVKEYLDFVAELKLIPKADRKEAVSHVMEVTGISDMSRRLIKNLSKGYKQRVGLAQAIINMPEIIILDEPTVGLDPRQIIEMRDLIRSLGKDHTVILSSHILSEVSEVCDHVFIIAKGQLVASDTVDNLENMVSGGTTLNVKAKGEEGAITEILGRIDGVSSFEFGDTDDEGIISFAVELDEGRDIRDTLSLEMAKASMPIMEMSVTRKSLEDVFLTLTGENNSKEDEPNVFDL
ncbi:MAG: ABC transporter ATP-binding protein [Eubacterium sp.]|nr:ABC transporter ATP-binding protein [Eubacterium sp.]